MARTVQTNKSDCLKHLERAANELQAAMETHPDERVAARLDDLWAEVRKIEDKLTG
jgi:hypothetical protein